MEFWEVYLFLGFRYCFGIVKFILVFLLFGFGGEGSGELVVVIFIL